MADVFVSLTSLRTERETLKADKLSVTQKNRAELNLSRIISQYIEPSKLGPTSFRLLTHSGKIRLFLQDDGQKKWREVSLTKNSALKQIERVVQFSQHMGKLTSSKHKPQKATQVGEISEDRILAVRGAHVPGSSNSIVVTRIAQESLDATRQIGFTIFGRDNVFFSNLGYPAAGFWSFFAVRDLQGGIADYKKAVEIGDAEGIRRAQARQASGFICTTASIVYLVGRIFDTLGHDPTAGAALISANVMFGVSAVVAMGSSLLGIFRCSRFKDRLDEYLQAKEGEKLVAPEIRFKAALRFLKDNVSVTPEEMMGLKSRIKKENAGKKLSKQQKEALLEDAMYNLTEAKVKYMKRRTSNKSLEMILSNADDLIKRLESAEESVVAAAVKEADTFFHVIQSESAKKMFLYALGFLCALLSTIACMLLTFASFGTFPFILYGIAGTVCLIISIANNWTWISSKLNEIIACLTHKKQAAPLQVASA